MNSHAVPGSGRSGLPALVRDIRVPVILLGLMRTMMIWWSTPLHSDFRVHNLPFARLSDIGLYPMIHYWSEYPPLFPYLSIGVYKILGTFLPTSSPTFTPIYECLMQQTTLLFELGAVYLLARTAQRRFGPATASACAWICAVLFSQALVMSAYFDHIAVFFLALALYLSDRAKGWPGAMASGAAAGAGTMVKLLPMLALPACWRRLPDTRHRIALVAGFLLGIAVCAAPFVTSPWAATSVRIMLSRGAWQSHWALMEGATEYGSMAPKPEHLQRLLNETEFTFPGDDTAGAILSTPWSPKRDENPGKSYEILGRFTHDLFFVRQSPRWTVPVYAVVGLAFVGSVAFVWLRAPDGSGPLPMAAFTVCAFLFCSKGWSPQFVAYAVPLLLFGIPDRRGAALALSVGVIGYLEMPVWVVYGGGDPSWAPALFLTRAALLAAAALCAARVSLQRAPSPEA